MATEASIRVLVVLVVYFRTVVDYLYLSIYLSIYSTGTVWLRTLGLWIWISPFAVCYGGPGVLWFGGLGYRLSTAHMGSCK